MKNIQRRVEQTAGSHSHAPASSSQSAADKKKQKSYQVSVWIITFLMYAAFHMTRKTFSVVKGSLTSNEDSGHIGYKPFDGTDGKNQLGSLDTLFLTTYAVCQFFSGHLADRSDQRYFVCIGLLGCSFSLLQWPAAYWWGIHSFGYFVVVNFLCGVFQSSGWPAVVTIMSHWFPKKSRGFVMGVWNSHTSVGNMLGSLLSALMIHTTMDGHGWPYAFVLPSVVAIVIAVFSFGLLYTHPSQVDLVQEEEEETITPANVVSSDSRVGVEAIRDEPVTFFKALSIPGVLEFSFALFFCKLVAYAFLFWLPYYLKNYYENGMASYLSIYFDLGGILGGIIAGYLADRFRMPATVSVGAMVICMPMLFAYRLASEHADTVTHTVVMFILGLFVNGPYALITTAVSAELGTHPMLGRDASALATVSGIVDGMGTAGAAFQGILVPLASSIHAKNGEENWDAVFVMLIICSGISALFLSRLVLKEVNDLISPTPHEMQRKVSLDDGETNTIILASLEKDSSNDVNDENPTIHELTQIDSELSFEH